jgi:2-methylcitrate dehydratase PrpD
LRSAHEIQPAQIARIEVDMSGFQFDMCGGKIITSRSQAQMSLPYAIAAELEYGKVGLAQIDPAAWTSERIGEWLNRISVRADDRMADEDEPIITIVTNDDHRYEASIAFPYGSPANPLPDDRLFEKFRDLSGNTLTSQTRDKIEEMVLTLDTLADVRGLPALLRKDGRRE